MKPLPQIQPTSKGKLFKRACLVRAIPIALAVTLLLPAPLATAGTRAFRGVDGAAYAVYARDETPLFYIGDADPIGDLGGWLSAHGQLSLEGIALERRLAPGGGVVVHRFEQRYRGRRVIGRGSSIAVTSRADGGVLSVVGSILDPRQEYAGADLAIDEAAARAALEAVPELAGRGKVVELELVGSPQHRALVWSALVRTGERAPEWSVLVSAADGAVLQVERAVAHDTFQHLPIVSVTARATTSNPGTATNAAFGGLPGSTFGAWSPITGHNIRMGNERAAVYDAENSNEDAIVRTTLQLLPNSNSLWSRFTGSNASTYLFRTQNLFQKMIEGLSFVDPVHDDFGWDHHPAAPFGVFTPGPLSLVTNVDSSPEPGEPNLCASQPAAFDLAFHNGWQVVEHPYPTNAYRTARISMCTNTAPGLLLHELGHYVDAHALYGIMGTGVATGTCHQDTTDEAISLRETLADMLALVLVRKMYPNLSYDFGTSSHPCTFQSASMGTSAVHTTACIPNAAAVGSFDVDRPPESGGSACTPTQGYRLPSVNQAVWAYLNHKRCNRVAPYGCAFVAQGGSDRFLPAFIYALTLSNQQSYVTFFENMSTYIWATWGAVQRDAFRNVMSDYGILDWPPQAGTVRAGRADAP